jgi:predicted porin
MASFNKLVCGRLALLAALGLFAGAATSAQAADLGGNCCADLEERIAELEATTARKGNRKVSLEVSGHVNEAIMVWDDGEETNAYVVTNDSGRSRFRFKGKAKISADWEAGYLLEIGVRSNRSDRVDQGGLDFNLDPDEPAAGDNGESNGFDIRHSTWYVKSKTLGALWVGFSNTATESITEINLSQTGDIAKNSDVEDHIAGFQLRAAGGSGPASLSSNEWRRLIKDDAIQPGEGSRANVVRYVSPSFAGFEASAAWGEDDTWDVALRYKGEFAGLKMAAGIGYGENSDATGNTSGGCLIVGGPVPDADCNQVGGSLSVMHEDSGLYLTFGAGRFVDEETDTVNRFVVSGADDDHTFYAFQAGIEKKWTALGKTTIYGEYFNHEGGANDRTFDDGDPINSFAVGSAQIFSSDVETYGGGIIQGIDAASMRLYLIYRHYEADLSLVNGAGAVQQSNEIEDVDVVLGGALIQF